MHAALDSVLTQEAYSHKEPTHTKSLLTYSHKERIHTRKFSHKERTHTRSVLTQGV